MSCGSSHTGLPPLHPYVPRSLHVPGFVPSTLSAFDVVCYYFSAVAVAGSGAWFFTGHGLRRGDKVLLCALVVLGLSHLVVETYYICSPQFYRHTNLLSEIWKLEGLADSRYVARNPFVLSVEVVLAWVGGPTQIIAAYGILRKRAWAHPLILVVNSMEMSMTAIMLLSSWFDSNPQAVDAFHFWFYYVFFNVLYGFVVPFAIARHSWGKISHHKASID